MIYSISTKGCKLPDEKLDYINKHIEKLVQLLPNLNSDLAFLELIIRRHKKKRLDHMLKHIKETSGGNQQAKKLTTINLKASSPVYYNGTIMLRLPKKPLVAHIFGTTIDEAINIGFERLVKELETYKGEHFQGHSEYSNHRSIRKQEE